MMLFISNCEFITLTIVQGGTERVVGFELCISRSGTGRPAILGASHKNGLSSNGEMELDQRAFHCGAIQ